MAEIKLQAAQAQVEQVGFRFKHLSIALHGIQTIAEVLETPDAWSAIQGDKVRHLGRGDTVSIISADGLTIADRAVCIKALAGHCWFGKPLRMVTLEDVSLFEDRAFKVVPAGTGFAIMSVRDARVDDKIFATADAAKAEILRRQPVQVVS